MKKVRMLFLMAAVVLVFGDAVRGQGMGSAITYQGRLSDGGSPANGKYDLEFGLYDEPNEAGVQVGSSITKEDVNVYDGYFTVALDFGIMAFNGDGRWLNIGVRPYNSTGAFTNLTPRQEMTPTPYALHTRGIFVDGDGRVGIGTTTPAAQLTVAGGILRAGSTMWGANADTHINLGTSSTTGKDGFDIAYATVGGGSFNIASDDYATVGGGGYNTASGNRATVGGGLMNDASGTYATVGGGRENAASGYRATVGGGYTNTASDWLCHGGRGLP